MTLLDLIRIVSAGGGFHVDCNKYTAIDLVRVANAASIGGGFIYIENASNLNVLDMVRIASAGKGHVIFKDVDLF